MKACVDLAALCMLESATNSTTGLDCYGEDNAGASDPCVDDHHTRVKMRWEADALDPPGGDLVTEEQGSG